VSPGSGVTQAGSESPRGCPAAATLAPVPDQTDVIEAPTADPIADPSIEDEVFALLTSDEPVAAIEPLPSSVEQAAAAKDLAGIGPERIGTGEDPRRGPKQIVRLRRLSKAFGKLHVLRSANLSFIRGESTVILGPSGTGKSVLLKHIVGLLRPDSGEVWFEGQRIDTLSDRELIEARKRIGLMFQGGALFDSMTVGENIEFPLVEHTKKSAEQRRSAVERVLALVGLPNREDQMPGSLSGGQRKRVALARAIVLEPCVMLYDEPTAGLDPMVADVINHLIVALSKKLGITSIVVTHDMVSANHIADRMVLLYDGRVICDGRPEVFRNSPDDLVQRFIHGHADQDDLERIRKGFEEAEGEGRAVAG